jgi:ribonuclease E
MSDVDRLADETNEESRPAMAADAASGGGESDRRSEESRPATAADAAPSGGESDRSNREPRPGEPSGPSTGGADTADTTARSASPGTGGNGQAPRKRRRGSRGGRNRKKRPAGAAAGAATTSAPTDAQADDDGGGGEDWTDAAADRGLTDDDIAAQAKEDAGLTRPSTSARPQVGDTRPTRSAQGAGTQGGTATERPEGAPKKRRRRRGGRGRSKGGGAGGNGGGAGSPATAGRPAVQYVSGELGDVDVDGTSLLESLDEETLERRRGTRRKGRPAGRYLMVVHQRDDGFAHIAVLEGRQLIEHYVSTPTDETTSIDGNIYLGRVQNVLPGMEAAFIDIDPNDVEGGEKPRIERVLRNGQAITVQVTKNPIGHKGARLTQEVSLAGRFVVMVPGQPQTYGISKRLPDDERRRLRRVLDRLRPADAGLIVRTAAEGATEEELERDMLRLNAQWQQISDLSKRAKSGSLLYKEPPLAIRLIREEFTKEYRGVVIDNRELYDEVHGYIEAMAPELAERVEFYDAAEENLPVFEKFHVHEQLHKALDRKVWLPSGGSLIIERTEALTVIDVNTGKNVGASNLEETVYRNNLEAAEVVARELRLRDIGGIIVIDFIDMEIKSNREAVENAFREALARDKTRTQVFPISELGLVEMTRKRVSEGLVEAFSSTCPHCNGRGFIVDESLLE